MRKVYYFQKKDFDAFDKEKDFKNEDVDYQFFCFSRTEMSYYIKMYY